MKKKNKVSIDYQTEAEPRATTKDGVPVFCSHDELVPLVKLIPNPKNPNMHSQGQVELLAEIISATGWRAPITISKRSGFITKGHGRRLAAIELAAKEVPVEYQDYASEAEEYADLVADNRIAELATIDNKKLLELIEDIDTGEFPIEMTGFTLEDIEGIIAAFSGDGDTEDDGADAEVQVPKRVMTKPGDLWELGEHRLMCGDSTDTATIEKLMQGEKAQIVNTDPPYGVSYDSGSKGGADWDAINGDELRHDDLMTALLIPVFKQYMKNTKDDAAFYIWHASSTRKDFEDAMTAVGMIEKQYIIWVKNGIALGRADYQWSHEPCFYAEKAGHSAAWYGDRSKRTTWKVTMRGTEELQSILTGGICITDGQGGTVFISEKPPKNKKTRYIRLKNGKPVYLYDESKDSTVWEVDRETGTIHPTQKPVELAIRAITNSSAFGDVVLDFFGGSGSTLIGAHRTGRKCYACELDPVYCDGIIKRYLKEARPDTVTCVRNGETYTLAELAKDTWDKDELTVEIETEEDQPNE